MFRVCNAFLSVHCHLVVTCRERADLLALLYVMLYCVFVTFPCGVMGKVWCMIVSIPDLYLLSYFDISCELSRNFKPFSLIIEFAADDIFKFRLFKKIRLEIQCDASRRFT